LQRLFDKKIQEEEGNLQHERYENRKHGNSNITKNKSNND